jgi:hypothetical protein
MKSKNSVISSSIYYRQRCLECVKMVRKETSCSETGWGSWERASIKDAEAPDSGNSVLNIHFGYSNNYYRRGRKEVFSGFNSYIDFVFRLSRSFSFLFASSDTKVAF